MKKFSAIACTFGFSAFWVFGGLAALGVINGHPVSVTMLALAAAGLGLGIYMRRRVVRLTQDMPVGKHVKQQERAAV